MPPLLAPPAAGSATTALAPPIALVTAAEGRVLGIRLPGPGMHRIRPGVYAWAEDWEALTPWHRYVTRVHAYLRVHPDAVLCLESAAAVLGLPIFGEPRDIHVLDPRGRSSRRFGDVLVHTSRTARALVHKNGMHATSARDTVVDLARVLPPAHGLAVADAALSATIGGGIQLEELRERDQERATTRGRARARWVWEHADGAAESVGESVSRAVITWCGFETPQLQRTFRYEGRTDRCDFWFPRSNAIGESDGWGKYGLEDAGQAARALADEKRREDRLRRAGHPFARWDLADVYRIDPLCAALDAAGVRRERPTQPAMLATLRERRRVMPPAPPALPEREKRETRRTR